MELIRKRATVLYAYWLMIGLLLAGLLLMLSASFANPIVFSIAVLYLTCFPGFLILRLLRYKSEHLVGQLLLYFFSGLFFYFLMNFIGMILGLKLSSLMIADALVVLGLFIAAFYYDEIKPAEKIASKFQLLKIQNLFCLLPLGLLIFVYWIIWAKGPGLNGDPYLHLAIVRKAFEGDSLSVRALALTKTQTINPAYLFGVWHIFLAGVSKFFSLDIFVTWNNILYVLAPVTFGVWYWFSLVLFKNKIWAIFTLTLMVIFTVYVGQGYIFTRLMVPDTFAQYLLLPIGWILALLYILEDKNRWQLIVLNLAVLISLLLVHGPHFFYLFGSVLIFGLIYALSSFRQTDYKKTLWKIVELLCIQIILLILIAIAIQITTGTVATSLKSFSAGTSIIVKTKMIDFSLLIRYGLFLTPLLLLFYREKRFLFIIGLMLFAPLIYWTPLFNLANKLLSGVFTDRLLANTSLYFLVFACILGAKLFIFDLLISKLKISNRQILNILLIILAIFVVVFEILTHKISDWAYAIFYSDRAYQIFDQNLFWFWLGFIFLVVVCGLIWHSKYPLEKFNQVKFNNPLTMLILFFLISFFLFSPSIVDTVNIKTAQKTAGDDYFLAALNKDTKGLQFISEIVPKKSVILTQGGVGKGLAALKDYYLAYNVGTSSEKKFDWVFEKTPDLDKIKTVTDPKWQIEYIYLTDPINTNYHFKAHPETYELIYEGNSEIYQVIK